MSPVPQRFQRLDVKIKRKISTETTAMRYSALWLYLILEKHCSVIAAACDAS